MTQCNISHYYFDFLEVMASCQMKGATTLFLKFPEIPPSPQSEADQGKPSLNTATSASNDSLSAVPFSSKTQFSLLHKQRILTDTILQFPAAAREGIEDNFRPGYSDADRRFASTDENLSSFIRGITGNAETKIFSIALDEVFLEYNEFRNDYQ